MACGSSSAAEGSQGSTSASATDANAGKEATGRPGSGERGAGSGDGTSDTTASPATEGEDDETGAPIVYDSAEPDWTRDDWFEVSGGCYYVLDASDAYFKRLSEMKWEKAAMEEYGGGHEMAAGAQGSAGERRGAAAFSHQSRKPSAARATLGQRMKTTTVKVAFVASWMALAACAGGGLSRG